MLSARSWNSLIYGPERLGHQTVLMREHMNRVATVACVVVVLVMLTMFLASIALLMAALSPGPQRQRITTETATDVDTTPPHRRNRSRRTSHPRTMVETAPFDGTIRESRCVAPRLVHCSSNLTALVRDHGWFYMPGAGKPGACIEWLPTHLCAACNGCRAGGGYRFSTKEECGSLCERSTPWKGCIKPLPLVAVYSCKHGSNHSEQHWWFYDPVSHACREWEHACIYKSYATMAECVEDCLPETPQY